MVCCGTPTDVPINRKTLDDPDDSGWITCCVDDPQQLAAFSRFQILSLDNNCRLTTVFRRARLQSLHYAVDVSSIQQILPEFVELYGPVHHKKTLPFGPDHTSEFATWWYGHDVLELNSATIYSEDLTEAHYHKTGLHYAKITYVRHVEELGSTITFASMLSGTLRLCDDHYSPSRRSAGRPADETIPLLNAANWSASTVGYGQRQEAP